MGIKLRIFLIAAILFYPGALFSAPKTIVKLKSQVQTQDLFSFSRQAVEYNAIGYAAEGKFLLTDEDANLLNGNPSVEYAEPNQILYALGHKEDLEPRAWGVTKIKAQAAWDKGITGKNIVVAVIDTGVDYNHPALKDRIFINEKEVAGNEDKDGNGYAGDIHGWNFADNTNDPMDDHSHGTHCSGTIAGIDIGVAPGVKILPIKFLNKDGSGSLSDAVNAIHYATLMKVDIMSNSWGGGGYSKAMFEMIQEADAKGIWFVAAAGNESNDNDKRPAYPASYNLPHVISVAATTDKDQLAYFSNYGEHAVHVAAPGVNIYSSVINGGYAAYSGTSMAAPHVSGAMALLLEYQIKNPKQLLMKSVDEGYLPIVTKGRINLEKAILKSQK